MSETTNKQKGVMYSQIEDESIPRLTLVFEAYERRKFQGDWNLCVNPISFIDECLASIGWLPWDCETQPAPARWFTMNPDSFTPLYDLWIRRRSYAPTLSIRLSGEDCYVFNHDPKYLLFHFSMSNWRLELAFWTRFHAEAVNQELPFTWKFMHQWRDWSDACSEERRERTNA